MREHVERGAEIVAKVSSFKGAVAAIRHHHERWDWLGYPDGLAGDDIPLEAAIIGLADAWGRDDDAPSLRSPPGAERRDASTPHRSRKAVQPGRVDAFFEVAKRRPSEILPPDDRPAAFGSSA
jgi:response regulator RpfG family c-di-GMP phosphodiesterase